MNTDKFIKELAKKYGKDERVIRSIVNSPFVFAKRTMMSLNDGRPIRIPKLCTLTVRWKRGKHQIKLMILSKVIKKLMYQYLREEAPAELKPGVIYAVNLILDQFKREGYENEQFVQHIIEWKNRVEAGDYRYTALQRDMGEGSVEDEGSSNEGN